MPDHKLSKNFCSEKIHSAAEQNTMPQINFTVIIHMIMIIYKRTTKAYAET
jgi:hypothetical protein